VSGPTGPNREPQSLASGPAPRYLQSIRGQETTITQPLYSTLDNRQIRLCDIRPGRPGDLISCELRTAFLDDDIQYDALSYV
jgi:hypothetical protein